MSVTQNSPQIILRYCSPQQTVYGQAIIENSEHTASLEFNFQNCPYKESINLPYYMRKGSVTTRSCAMFYPVSSTHPNLGKRYKDINTIIVNVNLPRGALVADERWSRLVHWIKSICKQTFREVRWDHSAFILHSKS